MPNHLPFDESVLNGQLFKRMNNTSEPVWLVKPRREHSNDSYQTQPNMYLTISLSVLAVLIAIYYYYLKNLNVFKRHGIPHIPPVPILGNMGPVMTMKYTMAEIMQQAYDLHPDAKYVGFYEFTSPVLYVRDVDLIKSISVRNFDSFQDHRSFLDPKVDPLIGGTLFFQNGEEWKQQRNAISPVFTSSKIRTMHHLMSTCAVRFADHLSKLPESEREVDAKAMLSRFANDVIASCVYGIEVDSMKDPNNEIFVKGKESVTLKGFSVFVKQLMYRNFPTLSNMLGISYISKSLMSFFENLVRDTLKIREENDIYRPDMLQLLMDNRNKKEAGKSLTIPNITSHSFGFFFGGFDSVTSQTSFVLRQLAEYPDVQAKLQAEIDETLEKNNGELPYDTIMQMEYLDAVVNETMRLYNLTPFLDRLCTKPFELPPTVPGSKPYVVQPGMNVWFPTWSIHRDSKYYDNPDKFDPERFVTDGKKILNSGAFMPFGIGPRMCIGARFALTEVKTSVCHILARCNIKLSPKCPAPLELNKGTFSIEPKNGFFIKIEPRTNVPIINANYTNEVCQVAH